MDVANFDFLTEQEKQVYRLRKEGKTYKEIAKIYKRSSSRIGQICLKTRYKICLWKDKRPEGSLRNIYWGCHDARIRNCLIWAEIKTIPEIINYSFSDLIKIRNLGRKSAMVILIKLDELGYKLKGENS